MISVNCPVCSEMLRADEKFAGRKGRCARCGSVFVICMPDSEGSGSSAAQSFFKPGDKVAGRYQITGAAPGGRVYFCLEDGITPRALKVFSSEVFSPDELESIKSCAEKWINMKSHPRIAAAFGIVEISAGFALVIEQFPGDELGRNNLWHFFNLLSLREILLISLEFCFAIDFIYSNKITAHGNIKPSNMMLSLDKSLSITDIGLYNGIALNPASNAPFTAPEAFGGVLTPSCDIYSFGVVLYQMASGGSLPFAAPAHGEYGKLHLEAGIDPIRSMLFSAAEKCMAKNPEDRPRGFKFLRQDLWDVFLKSEAGSEFAGIEPENLGLTIKGYQLDKRRKHMEAIECYDRALEIDSKDPVALSRRAAACFNLGRYDDAVECCNSSLEINPQDGRIWFLKGVAWSRLNNEQAAAECYDQALRIDPSNVRAWYVKGEMLDKKSLYREAITCFEHALEIDPDDYVALTGKGVALVNTGEYHEAIKCFGRALEINPENVLARRYLRKLGQ